MKRVCLTGDESDAHSRFVRRILCCFQRAGFAKKIKQSTNRRERREGKAEALEQYEEWTLDD